jgi:hypothetical protein
VADLHRDCKKAVGAGIVGVKSRDLARGVDALRIRTLRGKRIVKGDEAAAAVQKSVRCDGGVVVDPDDLARIVDADQDGPLHAQGIVNGGVSAAAVRVVEEAVDAGVVFVVSDDQAGGVDVVCSRAGGGEGIIEGGVRAAVAAAQEAVGAAGAVGEKTDDLPGGVDAIGIGAAIGGIRVVDGGVILPAEEKAVRCRVGGVIADDLAGIVDVKGDGGTDAVGIVDCRVSAAGVEEAVAIITIVVIPHDLPRRVDTECAGAVSGERVVQGSIGINRHAMDSSVLASVAQRRQSAT